jgi:filamentous hemagglutinin
MLLFLHLVIETANANGDITNSGRILAQGNLGLDAATDVVNLVGAILGAGVQPDGSLGGARNLTIAAGQNARLQGKNLASGNLTAKGNTVDLNHSQTQADSITLTATHGDIDASSATITAQHQLQANASGSFINDQAQTAAGTLQLTAANLSNLDGLILLGDSSGASDITLSNLFDNRGGLLHTTGQMQITANQVDNRNTTQSAQGIQGNDVTITADRINNGSGHILANQNIQLNSAGQIDNSQGLVSAGGNLSAQDGQATRSLAITNTQGTFVAGQNLAVISATLSGDGQLYAQQDIHLLLDGGFDNSGTLIANYDADLNIGGTLTNSGSLEAGNKLTTQASAVDNRATGVINAADNRTTTTGTITNRGLIDGGTTRLQANTIDNLGTGRIYGDHIAIGANDLTNENENGTAGTIAARNRLDIGVQTLENKEHALIYSAGDMSIGGALDANDQATGQAVHLTNSSATIDADGQIQLSAQTIDNLNAHLVTSQVDDATVTHEYVQPRGQSQLFDISACSGIGGGQDKNSCNGYPGTFEDYTLFIVHSTPSHTIVVSSDPGKIQAGGDIVINGALNNRDSAVIAGGDLVASQPVNNQATKGQDITRSTGTAELTTVESCGLFGSDHCREWHGKSAYNPAPVYGTPYDLPTLTYQIHTATGGTAPTIGNRTAIGSSQPVSQPINTSGGYAWAQPNTTLPSSSLFQVHDDNGNHPLIETDPRFADYRQWLSSDYMISALSLQPDSLLKRLGDGYYEQKLVQDQVAELTGRRFLTGYSSDEAQFQALMNAGVTYARQWHLIPGVALTAAQVAQLTSDMVWLVAKDVQLPNGKTERVLVPQVYAASNPNDPGSNGSLISANRIQTGGQGTWTNSGTIAGRNLVAVGADDINNLGGRILGNSVSLSARNDIDNIGGSIVAGDTLSLNAGRDINIVSTHQHISNTVGASQFSRDSILQTAQLKVRNTDGKLLASAGRDLVLTAANVDNAGTGTTGSEGAATQLQAGRDIRLDTLTTGQENRVVWDADNHDTHGNQQDVGTRIRSAGDLAMIAGTDIQAKAAGIHSDNGTLNLQAGHDIQLTDGQSSTLWDEARKVTSSGMFSSSTSISRDNVSDSRSVATKLSGQSVQLSVNHDITLQGNQIDANGNIALLAGDNISLLAGRNQHSESHYREEQKSGFSTKGYGKSHTIDTVDMASLRHDGSSLHSTQGNIALAANLAEQSQADQGAVLIEGSQVHADHGRVDVSGKHVILSTSEDQQQYSHSHQSTHSNWAFITGLPDGMRDGLDTQQQTITVNGSTLQGQNGAGVQATGLVDMTAARLKANQGDIDISGAQVAIRSGTNQQASSSRETHKKSGISWRDLTGLFTPGKGVGYDATLDKQSSKTTLAHATLEGHNIHIQANQGDITLAAVQAKATGTPAGPSDGSEGAPGNTVGPTPGQISLKAAGNIHLASISTESYQRTDEKHKDKAWQETHGEGSYDQQTHYNQLTAGQLDLQAGGRITADMSVRDSAAVLAKSPDMTWLRQLQQDPKLAGKVDWKQIEEAHQHWDYKHQGLTPAASAVVALVVAYFTAGAGSAIVNTAAGSATAAASGAGAVAAGMTQAAVSTMASHAAVSFINNGGDLGKTLNDLGSSQSMRQLATAVVTAGVLSGIGQVTFGEGKNAFRLNDVKVSDGFMKNMGKNLIDGVARATVNSAITGTDLQTNIRTNVVASILGAAQAQGADWIGNQTLLGGDFNTNGNVNEFAHEFAHAIVGCAAGVAGASASGSGASTGQGCSAGALGAVVGELSAQFYGGTDPNQTIAFAQMMGGIAAAAAGLGAEGVSIAANTGANAAQNNYMAHYDTYEKDLKACQQNPGGVNCGAILSLTEGTNARYLGMTQGGYRVAANMGKDGAASYTVVSPDGETMVMQPTEWAYFSQMTSGQQATIFSASQWQLDFNSMTEYGRSGDTTAAMANYAHMLTQPDYWVGMGAAFLPAGVLGRAATATDEVALLGRGAAEGAGASIRYGRADFYVNSNGQTIPSTGYRAIGGPAVNKAMAGDIQSFGETYITFDNISGMSPNEVKSLLQLPHAPSHVATFDTLPLVNDLQVPAYKWNTWRSDSFVIPEPYTDAFPEFAVPGYKSGGATQAITKTKIKNFDLKALPND